MAQSPAFEAVRVSACALSGAGMEEDLTSVVRELAEKVSAIEASVRVIDARLSEPNAGRRHAAPTALSAAEAAEPSEKQEQPSFGSSADLQAEFRAIRDSLSKVKLPQDLVVGGSRAGIGKGDLARFQVIQKCARFQETALKILSSAAQVADPVINQLTTVTLAQLRFLQEEYTHLIVSNQFDDSTAQLFKTLQHNPATFTPGAVENLQRAVTIAGARQQSRQVSQVSDRGRWRGPAPQLQRFHSGPASADWRSRGRPGLPPSRDLSRPGQGQSGGAGAGAAE